MCGIAGVVYVDPRRPVDRSMLERMTQSLAHRGPDAAGFHIGPGVGLGHRRLSIIDLAGGGQPLYNEDKTCAVLLNGEIYNFQELRSGLEASGHRFRTASDTEAIVHAWEEYGEDCVSHLRGMFAFAAWDSRHRRAFLARDRVGKKPLYYVHAPDRLLFASELKALLADTSVSRDLNVEALDEYLTFGSVTPPRTICRGIQQLPPGHYLVWESGRVQVVQYWDLIPEPGPARSEAEYLDEFDEILTEAVRLRMISDVPIGAFLSGGVDSSAVVLTMARQSSRPVLTTSVAFEESAFNEAPFARTVATTAGADHHEVLVRPDAAGILPKLIWHLDEPFADASALPTYYVSKAARERMTVVLSGDGGDELFGGYAWRYGLNRFEDGVRRWLPAWMRAGIAGRMATIWPKADWVPRAFRWKYFLRNLSLSPERAYFYDMSLFTPIDKTSLLTPDFQRALNGFDPFDSFSRWFKRAAGLDHLSRIMYVDSKTYLPNDILVKVDRMAMANSLEVRCPLLDHKVMEFAARVPPSLKFRGMTSKYLVKKYLERRLPSALVHRPKKGFSIPLAQWLRHDLRELAEDLLLSLRTVRRGYFEPRTIKALWQDHASGRRDHSGRLWALMVFELWHRVFLDERLRDEPLLVGR